MSQKNVEIVQEALHHLDKTGEPKWDLYASDLVWKSRPDGPAHFTYRGIDGLRQGLASLSEVWAEFHVEVLDLVDCGDVVVSEQRWRLRAQSGVELEVVEGWASWIRDGRIVRIEQHPSRDQALKASGLSE